MLTVEIEKMAGWVQGVEFRHQGETHTVTSTQHSPVETEPVETETKHHSHGGEA